MAFEQGELVGPDPPNSPRAVLTYAKPGTCPALRGFSFLMHATPVIEGLAQTGLKKIPVQRGTCGPRVNSHGIRSAGAPPQV
jgi:hypothetical protein